jgi:ankyrin repeat protein
VNALAGTHNANVEAADEDGGTALMLAAFQGHTDTVNALAGTHNANVEAAGKDGWTALMLAAGNGHTDTVNALAGTHNANVEAADKNGWTALMQSECRLAGTATPTPSTHSQARTTPMWRLLIRTG